MKNLVKISLASVLFLCIGFISTPAQKAVLEKDILPFNKTLKSSKAKVEKSFEPKHQADADIFYIRFRYHQMVEITVSSNTVFLSKENECGMYFKVFDDEDKELWLGDSPAGIDLWQGEIKNAGIHKIKVYMGCLEAFALAELQKKKPKFNYALEILGSKSPTR